MRSLLWCLLLSHTSFFQVTFCSSDFHQKWYILCSLKHLMLSSFGHVPLFVPEKPVSIAGGTYSEKAFLHLSKLWLSRCLSRAPSEALPFHIAVIKWSRAWHLPWSIPLHSTYGWGQHVDRLPLPKVPIPTPKSWFPPMCRLGALLMKMPNHWARLSHVYWVECKRYIKASSPCMWLIIYIEFTNYHSFYVPREVFQRLSWSFSFSFSHL